MATYNLTKKTLSPIEKANHVLNQLESGSATVELVLKNIFIEDPVGYKKAGDNIANACYKTGLAYAYGAFHGGPQLVCASYVPSGNGWVPTDVDLVVDILKSANRIMQIGSGKGIATVVLKVAAIQPDEYDEKTVPMTDANGLAKALKDAVGTLTADNKFLRSRIYSLEEELIQIKQERDRLINESTAKYRTSWT